MACEECSRSLKRRRALSQLFANCWSVSGCCWIPALSALPYNQGDDERAMRQEETRVDPVLLRGLPSGHASCWHITHAGGCGGKWKGRVGGQEKSDEGQLTERLFFSLFLRRVAFSLSNFTKDHRLVTARDIKQFYSPTLHLHHWYSSLRLENTSELLWRCDLVCKRYPRKRSQINSKRLIT